MDGVFVDNGCFNLIMENIMKKVVYCLSLGMVGSLLCYTLPASAGVKAAAVSKAAVTRHAADVVIVNKSDEKQLASLKGLGEVRAKAVVAYRKQHGPFKSVNDLVKVKGVGAKLLARVIKNNPGKLRLNEQ